MDIFIAKKIYGGCGRGRLTLTEIKPTPAVRFVLALSHCVLAAKFIF
jgi:hypothetical protein